MLGLVWLCLQSALLPAAPDVGALLAKLESPSEGERQAAAKALAAIGPSAMPPVMDAVSGYDRGQLATDTAMAQALGGGYPPGSQLRAFEAAMKALADMGAPAIPALRRYLRKGSNNVRLAAAAAFSLMHPAPSAAVPELAQALFDPVYLVRKQAQKALRGVGPPAMPVVARALAERPTGGTFDIWDARSAVADLIVESGQSEAPAVASVINAFVPREAAAAHYFVGDNLLLAARAAEDAAVQARELELANRHLERSLVLNPVSDDDLKKLRRECLLALVEIAHEGGRKGSEDHVRQLLQFLPKDAKAVATAASYYRDVGRNGEGEALLKGLVEATGHSDEACVALADFSRYTSDKEPPHFDAVIGIYQECERARPTDARAAYRVAESFARKGGSDPTLSPEQRIAYLDKGIEAAERALKLDPESAEAVRTKADLLGIKARKLPPGPAHDALLKEVGQLRQKALELLSKKGAGDRP